MSVAAPAETVVRDLGDAGRRAERSIGALAGWTGVAAGEARADLTLTALGRRRLVASGGEVVCALRRLEADLAEVTAVRRQAASAVDEPLRARLTATAYELEDAAARRAAAAIDSAGASLPSAGGHGHRHHWWDGATHLAGRAWHAAEHVGESALRVAGALGHHGDDVGHVALDALGTALGVALAAAGSGVESGGVVLDATGVGAIAGVPLNIAGAALMAAGGGLAAASGAEFGKDAGRLVRDVGDDLQAAPGYDVRAHEGINGAHVLERHVGLTDEELVQRLESSDRIEGASTFEDTASAQRWIQRTLDQNWPELERWLSSGKGKSFDATSRFDEEIGRTVMRGYWENGGSIQPAHELKLVIRRAPEVPNGFVIRTVKIYP